MKPVYVCIHYCKFYMKSMANIVSDTLNGAKALFCTKYFEKVCLNRVRTDLEKSLNMTLVLKNSWNLKIVPFVLEFCKIALENVKWSLKIIKYIDSFLFFWICDAQKKTVKIAEYVEEQGTTPYSDSVCPVVPVFINTIIKIYRY